MSELISSILHKIPVRGTTGIKAFVLKYLRMFLLVLKGFQEDECSLWASALTFYSLLSVVPLMALAFGIAKGFGLEKILEKQLLENIPGQEQGLLYIIDFARKLLENTRGGLIAGVGVIVLLWSVINALGNIERSFNFICGIQKSRSLSRKFSDYLSIALIALILVIISSSVSVFITTQITMMAEKHKLFEVVSPALLSSLKFIPYGLTWLLFSFMYIFIPNTKVRFFSGVLAGLIAGTIYQVVQGGYIYFQVKISNYNAIYGSFAALPFFVLWLQMSWLVVLFGEEISFYHQNIEAYQHDDQFSSLSLSLQKLLALRIAHLIIINFSQGKPPLTDHHIAHTLTLPLPLVQQHLTELTAGGILSNTPVDDDNDFAYQPAKAIDLLTVQFVLNALEHQGRNTAQFIQEKEFSVFADILQQFDQTVAQSPANRLLKDISLEVH